MLHRFFDAMREMRGPAGQPYCTYNPVKLIHEGINRSCAAEDVEQALTDSEWLAVLKAIENLPQGSEREKHYHRARWIMQLLYRSLCVEKKQQSSPWEVLKLRRKDGTSDLLARVPKPKSLQQIHSWTS